MSDSDALSPRAQQAAERLLEDEGLTGDLTDDQAQPLIAWAGAAAVRAADPAFSDEQLAAALAAIRKALRQAAREAADDPDPGALLARAQALLAEAAPQLGAPPSLALAPAAAEPPPEPIAADPAPAEPPPEPPAADPAPAEPPAADPAPAEPAAEPPARRSIRALASRRISALAHMVSTIFQRRG